MSGKRKRGRPKKRVKEEIKKICLKKEDALNRAKWRDGVRAIAEVMGWIRPSLMGGQHQIKTP